MTPTKNSWREPQLIGKAFENYALEFLFPREDFDFLERVPEYTSNKKHFALNALNPDFKFKDKKTGRVFFVEVKFRGRRKKAMRSDGRIQRNFRVIGHIIGPAQLSCLSDWAAIPNVQN